MSQLLLQPDYTELFKNVPGLHLILLPDLTIVDASDAYLAATLTVREEIKGKNLFEVFPDNPNEIDATGVTNLRASLQRVLRNKIADTMSAQKYDVRRPDGSFEEKHWSPQNKPILNSKNEVVFIIHTVEDITEFIKLKKLDEYNITLTKELQEKVDRSKIETYRRALEIRDINTKLKMEIEERERLQNQLRDLNNNLESQVKEKTAQIVNIFERITDGFIALDKNLHYVYANEQIGKMTGKNPEDLIGKYVWDVFPDAIDSGTFKAFNKAMEDQQYINNIDYYSPLDLWQENHIYPSTDGLSIFVKDITIQKRAQLKIEKEKDFSDAIINSLPGIFYLFDTSGKMLRWNKNFEEVSGYSADEIATMHPTEFFDTADEKAYISSRIMEVFTKGESNAETSFFTKSKRRIPYYFTGISINIDNTPHLLGTGIDIEEKVKSAEELKKSYEQIRALAMHLQEVREEERKAIAREIHDELGQQLTGLKMDISWVNRKLENKTEEVDKKIQETLALTDEAVKTVRRIATSLRPSILDDLGLIAAIEWQSGEFEKRFNLPIVFKSDINEINLPGDVATGLFRIYQESLTNVLRHANATKVTSSITQNGGVLTMNISDDGKGFEVKEAGGKKPWVF